MAQRQPNQHSTFRRHIVKYVRDYGGLRAIGGSPFFVASVAFSILSYAAVITGKWSDSALSILPNLLGFSLGTYAMLFSLMSPRLKQALKAVKNRSGVAYIDEINATFLHFIFVQIITIIWAFLFQQSAIYDLLSYASYVYKKSMTIFAVLRDVGSFIGCVMFFYSLSLVMSASLAVYRLARLVEPS